MTDAPTVIKVESLDPLTIVIPSPGPYFLPITILLPTMTFQLVDLSLDGLIPGNPGIYGEGVRLEQTLRGEGELIPLQKIVNYLFAAREKLFKLIFEYQKELMHADLLTRRSR